MDNITRESPVLMLPGVGKARASQLERLGIKTVNDLVYFFPRAYECRGNVRQLSRFEPDIPGSFLLTVATEVHSSNIRRGLTISKFRAFDDSGSAEIVFFNCPFIKDVFHVGAVFRFFGKPVLSKNKLQLQNPRYEAYVEGIPLPDYVPIYHLTVGITSKQIEKLVRAAIEAVLPSLTDPLPEDVRLKYNLPSLSYAVMNAHFPDGDEALKKSLARLAFDEMLTFALGISISRERRRLFDGIPFSPCSLTPLTEKLPYELTGSQKSVINDIYRDTVLAKDGRLSPMTRIIVGDVGSGKTVCATAAIYIAARSGYQTALMVPTEILARQHYQDMRGLLSELGIRTELLIGATTQKEKKRIMSLLESGEVDLVIGTHALISDKVSFKNLGLVVTDEQHRFGVGERARLKDKSQNAHMLVMSATPIPRTLALAMYGDLDVSRITEMPKGRERVDTFVVNEGYRARLNDFIKKQVALGGQCYIVCPSIEPGEDGAEAVVPNSLASLVNTRSLNLKNALEYTEELRLALPTLKIETLHGRMRSSEKDEIMARFICGECNVLVSTTVIEVGVNVPNASLMIVENAERFGLSQLHQLRGRVGRGKRKSYCVLVSDSTSERAVARLEAMRTTYDGYEIAEKDLALRGPGDFFSTNSNDNIRQSGGFEFKFASICDDATLFESAFAAAKDIVSRDPALSLDENKGLREELLRMTGINTSLIS